MFVLCVFFFFFMCLRVCSAASSVSFLLHRLGSDEAKLSQNPLLPPFYSKCVQLVQEHCAFSFTVNSVTVLAKLAARTRLKLTIWSFLAFDGLSLAAFKSQTVLNIGAYAGRTAFRFLHSFPDRFFFPLY